MMDEYCLRDLGVIGYRFIWNNNSQGVHNAQTRLDQFVANTKSVNRYTKMQVKHLLSFIRDGKKNPTKRVMCVKKTHPL